MDTIPVDLYGNIFGFLSAKEKITMREVCKNYESKINRINLVIIRLGNILAKSHSRERKMGQDLILTFNNNFLMYTDYTPTGIHSLFRMRGSLPIQYNRCIDVCCREKRLGNIYFSKDLSHINYHQHYGWNFYSKRKIPYCLNCYNKWS